MIIEGGDIMRVEERIKRLREQLITCATSERNKKTVDDYINGMMREGFRPATVKIRLESILFLSKYTITDLDKFTKKDIVILLDAFETHRHNQMNDIRPLSATTKTMYKKNIRKFLSDIGHADLAGMIKTRPVGNHHLPDDLLTKDEIERMINAAINPRDRAFISVLYESGARIGELLSCKIKHAKFDDNGVVLTLPDGKTGARRIRLVYSSTYLRQWFDTHPRKEDRNADMWVRLDSGAHRIDYEGIRMAVKRVGKRAGIQKPVNLHNFRHTRATHLAEHLTEQQMKAYLGWTAGSGMAAVYVHLSGKDMDNAILKMHGIEKDTHINETLKVGKCPRCHEINQDKASFCFKCGMPLTESSATIESAASDEILMKTTAIQGLIDAAIKAALQEMKQ